LIETHFAMLSPDKDDTEEDVVRSLLGVLGYAAQTLEFHPDQIEKVIRYLRSERLRLLAVSQETRYPFLAREGSRTELSV
jgi:hypothetical protein